MHGGLVPFSFQASWPRGGGKQGVGGRSAPRVPPPGDRRRGRDPESHSPLPQPSSPEKLVQLFFGAALFLGGRGGPAWRALGVCRRRVAQAGVGPEVGDHPPAAPTPQGKRARRRAGGIWVSGRLSGRGSVLGTRRCNRWWGGDARSNLLPRGIRLVSSGWPQLRI